MHPLGGPDGKVKSIVVRVTVMSPPAQMPKSNVPMTEAEAAGTKVTEARTVKANNHIFVLESKFKSFPPFQRIGRRSRLDCASSLNYVSSFSFLCFVPVRASQYP